MTKLRKLNYQRGRGCFLGFLAMSREKQRKKVTTINSTENNHFVTNSFALFKSDPNTI